MNALELVEFEKQARHLNELLVMYGACGVNDVIMFSGNFKFQTNFKLYKNVLWHVLIYYGVLECEYVIIVYQFRVWFQFKFKGFKKGIEATLAVMTSRRINKSLCCL